MLLDHLIQNDISKTLFYGKVVWGKVQKKQWSKAKWLFIEEVNILSEEESGGVLKRVKKGGCALK